MEQMLSTAVHSEAGGGDRRLTDSRRSYQSCNLSDVKWC